MTYSKWIDMHDSIPETNQSISTNISLPTIDNKQESIDTSNWIIREDLANLSSETIKANWQVIQWYETIETRNTISSIVRDADGIERSNTSPDEAFNKTRNMLVNGLSPLLWLPIQDYYTEDQYRKFEEALLQQGYIFTLHKRINPTKISIHAYEVIAYSNQEVNNLLPPEIYSQMRHSVRHIQMWSRVAWQQLPNLYLTNYWIGWWVVLTRTNRRSYIERTSFLRHEIAHDIFGTYIDYSDQVYYLSKIISYNNTLYSIGALNEAFADIAWMEENPAYYISYILHTRWRVDWYDLWYDIINFLSNANPQLTNNQILQEFKNIIYPKVMNLPWYKESPFKILH